MLLRRIARPLLAAPFVYDGVQAALHPAEHVDAARDGAALVTGALGTEPLSDRQVSLLVRVHGAATAFAGLLLAVGRTPRTAALTLAALTAPLAVAHQPFTSKGDERRLRTAAFVKDLGKVGAAVIAGIDLEGKPGLTYRVQAARRKASRELEHAKGSGARELKHAKHRGARELKHAKHAAAHQVEHAKAAAERELHRAAS
ncbi:DoxX family membrane protein [Isoptericola hypogeus]|uniref:DoxX family membrane protein n=1 Tax=Isoptericola hypogeus TaxID=300179 RepID=A0ABN2IQG3_9MICO